MNVQSIHNLLEFIHMKNDHRSFDVKIWTCDFFGKHPFDLERNFNVSKKVFEINSSNLLIGILYYKF